MANPTLQLLADKFINDNINTIANNNTFPSIDGTLYFWEQHNPSHVLRDYQGGWELETYLEGWPQAQWR
jgi:hypothetical protein